MSQREKFALRSEMRKVLANLDSRWLEAASHELGTRLAALIDELPYEIEHLLAWVSFFPGEADLSEFLNQQLDKRAVYLPQIREDRHMNFISVGKEWLNSMEQGSSGIPEPSSQTGKTYDVHNAPSTAILIPGLAFDKAGARLGRGKGYYDTFLSRSSMLEATTIGIGWSLQLLPKVPADSHDVRMHYLCTEEGAITVQDAVRE